MRVSTSVMSNLVTNSMSNAYNNYANIIAKIASNKNFTKVSENVVDATRVLKLNDQLAKLNEYQSNITHATNEMNLAYDTLANVTEELSAINSLIVEAANATTTPDSAKAIAAEIKQRVATISDQMNVKYMDNYIFSGTYTEQQPYVTNDTGEIIYEGSSEKAGDRNLTISEDTVFTYNFTGEAIFGKQDGVNDFFSQMRDLDNLLNADTLDYDAIREKLSVLDSATRGITLANGQISSKVSKLESTQEINNDTITSLTEKKVDLEEVDITKAATELASAQTALQASYQIGVAVLGSVSLLDYI